MRVLKDVVIHRTDTDELLAVSRTSGIIGEEMTLDLMGAGGSVALRVRVVESRPVIVEGTVCHRVRLAVVKEESVPDSSSPPHDRESTSEGQHDPVSLSGPLAKAI